MILFHGTSGWELFTASRYVKNHPNVLFYVDSHGDQNNSARTFFSREVLHKLYYGSILRRVMPRIAKILCVSLETMDFVEHTYGIPRNRLEFYPLGGHLLSTSDYESRRQLMRAQMNLAASDILLVQSGKQTRRKKLLESLEALSKHTSHRMRLVIAGTLDESIQLEAMERIGNDSRITYVGWKSPEELTNLLCAADVYLQPGTQSATMQHSLCCRCAVILDDVPSHQVYLQNNGWLINNQRPLEQILAQVEAANLDAMKEQSFKIAEQLLNYRTLAKRVLQ